MAHNRLVDHYRRASARVIPTSEDDPDDRAIEAIPDQTFREPDRDLDRRRLAQCLLRLLDELPEAQREVFLLREEGGLSLGEIAETTGSSIDTAKSRLRYALAKLRRGLARENLGSSTDQTKN